MLLPPNLLQELKLVQNNDRRAAPFVHLQQLYEFEFSAFTKYKIDKFGLYDQQKLCEHWSEHGVDIYLAYRNNLPIGFAVVNLSSLISGDLNTRDVAEFFVMPEERMNQVGKWLACEIFSKYVGNWEVRQLKGLESAHSFWLRPLLTIRIIILLMKSEMIRLGKDTYSHLVR